MRWTCTLGLFAMLAGCATGKGDVAPAPPPDPHAAHRGHPATGMAYYALGGSSVLLRPANNTFKIVRVVPVPDGFAGHLAYDPGSGRLWLISFGPPANTRGPSTLYEVDPATGKVLAQVALPFRGEFGAPLYLDGSLYQGIYHEQKIYQIAVGDRSRLGEITRTFQVSSLAELDLRRHKDRVFRYPFFTFSALVATPDKKLLTHSDDLGEFLTIDPGTGKVIRQVETQPSLEGLIGVPGPKGEFLVIGNANPREFAMKDYMRKFLFRGAATAAPMASQAPVEETGVIWMLLDPESGEVLSSIWHAPSRAKAGGIALAGYEKAEGAPYGLYRFFALGQEGLLTIEWMPNNTAWSVIDRGSAAQ